MKLRRSNFLLAAACSAALVLVGCGESSDTPADGSESAATTAATTEASAESESPQAAADLDETFDKFMSLVLDIQADRDGRNNGLNEDDQNELAKYTASGTGAEIYDFISGRGPDTSERGAPATVTKTGHTSFTDLGDNKGGKAYRVFVPMEESDSDGEFVGVYLVSVDSDNMIDSAKYVESMSKEWAAEQLGYVSG